MLFDDGAYSASEVHAEKEMKDCCFRPGHPKGCCPGWLHVEGTDYGGGAEIQNCDPCGRFLSDEDAEEAHQKECGCDHGQYFTCSRCSLRLPRYWGVTDSFVSKPVCDACWTELESDPVSILDKAEKESWDI